MVRKHLGRTIDIHGGGSDLTFPHHENEAAQSRSANDNAEYVRYWLHNGMLTLGDEKMSKSTGNIVTIRELLGRHPGETLRYALLSGQYRSPLAWSEDLLKQATASLDRLYGALRKVPGNETSSAYRDTPVDDFPASVTAALCDDLNTPQALAALHAIAGDIHKTADAEQAQVLRSQLLAGGWLLGLLDRTAEAHFQQSTDIDSEQIDTLIEARISARQNKDYARADEIRDELTALGVELEDTADGTRWKLRGDND